MNLGFLAIGCYRTVSMGYSGGTPGLSERARFQFAEHRTPNMPVCQTSRTPATPGRDIFRKPRTFVSFLSTARSRIITGFIRQFSLDAPFMTTHFEKISYY